MSRDGSGQRNGDPPNGRAERSARAAFALGLLLFALALPWPQRPEPPCLAPREAEARDGHTVRVRCDGIGPPLRGPARLLFGERLDPNRADARSLEALPGIGPVRAAAIVAERDRRPFRDVSELRRVAGIGPATLRKILPWIEVTAPGRRSSKIGSLPKVPSGGLP